MTKTLVIVFVKNIKLGKVKTRLAKTIGNQGAFEVYTELVKLTETATTHMQADKRIYFSETILDDQWMGFSKYTQEGEDLGARMKNAFQDGFNDGYERIVLIGSDLPDITATHINAGLEALQHSPVVFGPAVDGGYYLIGLSKLQNSVFNDKPWSASHLLEVTLDELKTLEVPFELLDTLNDIDTFEDLTASSFYKNNIELQEKIKQLHD